MIIFEMPSKGALKCLRCTTLRINLKGVYTVNDRRQFRLQHSRLRIFTHCILFWIYENYCYICNIDRKIAYKFVLEALRLGIAIWLYRLFKGVSSLCSTK